MVWPARIDKVVIALALFAALVFFQPSLQPLFESIEVLGIKVKLRTLEGQVSDVIGATESTSKQVDLLSASNPHLSKISQEEFGTAGSDTIESIAREYDEIRSKQSPGDKRTAAMTDVFRRMIDVAHHTKSFNIVAALQNDRPGMRLFAYAYLYARPDQQFLDSIVQSVICKEDTPFGQYWGLQSMRRVISNAADIPMGIEEKLQAFSKMLPRGTDRYYEVKRLLDLLKR